MDGNGSPSVADVIVILKTVVGLLPVVEWEQDPPTPPDAVAAQIRARYQLLQEACERKDIVSLMSLVSLHYPQHGMYYDDFKQAFVSLFTDLDTITATFTVTRVTQDAANPKAAQVDFDGLIVGRNLQTGQIERNDVGGTMDWYLEGGFWVMYGDQRR
ncbi:MAG TPA: hypothetical protein VGN26_12140 [Armatimonadota bacterium]|jgi:hypothetical protein